MMFVRLAFPASFLVSFLALFLTMAPEPAAAKSVPGCGGEGKPTCNTLPAKKQKSKPFCSGGFIDVGTGKCYKCGSGERHNGALSAKTKGVCYVPGAQSLPNRDGKECKSRGRNTRWNWRTWKVEEYGPTVCKSWGCPGGTIAEQNGKCLRCPSGYKHHVFYNVKDKRVCQAPQVNKTASPAGGSILCPKGSFLDLKNGGECWACPDGYNRTAQAVDHAEACVARHVCKDGLVDLGGTCRKLKKGQSPFLAQLEYAWQETDKFFSSNPKSCRETLGTLDISIPMTRSLKAVGYSNQCLQNAIKGYACEATAMLDFFYALGQIGKDGEGILKALESDYLKWRDSKQCQAAVRHIDKNSSLDALTKVTTRTVVEVSCAVGLMALGETIQDNICLAKASAAGAFELKRPPAAASCQNIGGVMYVISDTALSTFITAKLAGPVKKRFEKFLRDRRYSKNRKNYNGYTTRKKDVDGHHDLDKLDADDLAGDRSIDKLMKIMKYAGGIKTVAGAYDKVSKIPECVRDWTPQQKKDAGVPPGQTTSSSSGAVIAAKSSGQNVDLIFGIEPNGELKYYEYQRAKNWRQTDVKIGTGWIQRFGTSIFAGGPGEFYGIEKNGDLLFYRYDFKSGKWAIHAKKIGTGWQGQLRVFSNGGGSVYAIRKNGDLMAFRHDDNGRWLYANKKIGTGWHDFRHVFGGGGGVIYAINKFGHLLYYRHGPDHFWLETSRRFGDGWQVVDTAFSTGGGRIFAVKQDGALYRYQHDTGLGWPVVNDKLGTGWTGQFGGLIIGSIETTAVQATARFNPRHGWDRLQGKAIDAGAGPEGELWAISADKDAYEWTGGKWVKRSSGTPLTRVAVAGQHEVWAIAQDMGIWRIRHGRWTKMPGQARDVGVGPDGRVMVVGSDRNPYAWDGKKWNRRPGSGQDSISVGPNGTYWIVNASNVIWRWDGGKWIEVKGLKGKDVAVGPGGRVYVVGTDGRGYTWGGGNKWNLNPPSGAQARVAALPEGPVVINSVGEIWRVK